MQREKRIGPRLKSNIPMSQGEIAAYPLIASRMDDWERLVLLRSVRKQKVRILAKINTPITIVVKGTRCEDDTDRSEDNMEFARTFI